MKLSEHFFLTEFLQSQTASRHGIILDPGPIIVANLTRLCVNILEPLRVALARAVYISSGYRNDELNRLIGGAVSSAHLMGRAADFTVAGMTTVALVNAIRDLGLPVDKCIAEFPDSAGGGWVHAQVSELDSIDPRFQYLTATRQIDGSTVYSVGV